MPLHTRDVRQVILGSYSRWVYHKLFMRVKVMDACYMPLVIVLQFVFCVTVNGSIKKGVAVNPRDYLCGDLAAFDNIAWWYDWGGSVKFIEGQSGCDLSPYTNKYVPMIWGYGEGWYDDLIVEEGTKYILGFNEPNHGYQANLQPQTAANAWAHVEQLASDRVIVSPAAAPCGENCITTTAEGWFNDFFTSLCNSTTPCRMQYMATHHYPQYNPFKSTKCSVQKTLSYLQTLYNTYNLKIWLTEFACAATTDASEQLKYMQALLPELEKADHVFRYSWYVSRSQAPADEWVTYAADLFYPNSSELNELGTWYNNFVGSSGSITTTTTTTTSSTSTSTSSTSSTTSTTSAPDTTSSGNTPTKITTDGGGGGTITCSPSFNMAIFLVSYLVIRQFGFLLGSI